ncbi:hypothetical protein D0463_02685 [Bacillus sp. V59.32b]|nr:hypothetical protein D0463_02685 [Bacillus sp. V59.32b]
MHILTFKNSSRKWDCVRLCLDVANCWDKAPIESFFGHLKDEANIKTCKTLTELKREIDKYIT